VASASPEASQAIKSIRLAEGLRIELFAAEPMLANPVAFCIDETGRFFVAETFRHTSGVTDNRSHMNWLDADMASRTVADRVAMYRKYLSPNEFADYGRDHERVKLIEDRDGDGRADRAVVFADGFKDVAAGIGAGLLARKGDVYFTCIPDLWKLRDNDGDGKAEVKQSLSTGYGVHVAFLGHDLHGLRFGPDGRLYFSIGDRGLDVTTKEGRHLVAPDSGSVLRCAPDGSNLEIFATGLRNPQELAFDNHGNLFTCDNNSDGGDRARWVHLVEGGDSGWRMGYQYLDFPTSRGPWNAEKLWYPRWDGQAAYLLPPLINISDGPSGLTHDPGTGLPARFRNHFLLADFRGTDSGSGVRSFANKEKGASFELVDSQQFAWSVLATDVDFGPDGAVYISDWTNGWTKPGKGRIWKITAKEHDPRSDEVKTLIAEGMSRRVLPELAELLGHADQRVRQEAQFELAARGLLEARVARASSASPETAVGQLIRVARDLKQTPLARLHAIWGLGQISRSIPLDDTLETLTSDADAEVRTQAVKMIGEIPPSPSHTIKAGLLARLLGDSSPRVQFAAAMALAHHGQPGDGPALLGLLRSNADRDAYLRHAAVFGLAGIGAIEPLVAAATDPSPAVRLGALLALRRLGRPEVARFLTDADPALATEAALAIYEAPIVAALPELSRLAGTAKGPEPLLRRALNAANRVGRLEDARGIAYQASRTDAPRLIRVEALKLLAAWANPPGRDMINGLWRPIQSRPAAVAAEALRPRVGSLLGSGPEDVRREAIRAVASLGIKEAGGDLLTVLLDGKVAGTTRAEAIRALETLGDPKLSEAVESAVADRIAEVRSEGLRILAHLSPDRAIPAVAKVLEVGTTAERQKGFAVLGQTDRPEADVLLASWLDRFAEGKAPPAIELDLVEAARQKASPEVKRKLALLESRFPREGSLAGYHGALEGGDAERGRKIYRDNAAVYCVRCHKVRGEGGEVGPELTGIGKRQPRTYLLESIVEPNKAIAQGFESVVIATDDGQVVTGVLKGEDEQKIKVMTAEAKLVEVPKSRVEERKRGDSAMPADLHKKLSNAEVRDLVEFLANLK
jgi:quinoprotein glucose dehydrogenase